VPFFKILDHSVSVYNEINLHTTALPSGSAKCLRFGHWLTFRTLNMHLLTYLLTYLLKFTETFSPLSTKGKGAKMPSVHSGF